jgi:hypothetical protein
MYVITWDIVCSTILFEINVGKTFWECDLLFCYSSGSSLITLVSSEPVLLAWVNLGSCLIWSRLGEFSQAFSCGLVLEIAGGLSRSLLWYVFPELYVSDTVDWNATLYHRPWNLTIFVAYDHSFYGHCVFVVGQGCVCEMVLGGERLKFVCAAAPQMERFGTPSPLSHTHRDDLPVPLLCHSASNFSSIQT